MWRNDQGEWIYRNVAFDCAVADIRANVASAEKPLREEIARLSADLESVRTHMFHMREAYGREMRKAQEEAAKQTSEVERLKAELTKGR